MAVSGTTKRQVYSGSGSAGPFPILLQITEETDLRVVREDEDGNESDLVLNAVSSGFSIDAGLENLTLTEELAVGEKLTFLYDIPLTQDFDIFGNDPFPASEIENQLDRSILVGHQLQELIDRSIKLKDSSEETSIVMDDPVAGKFLKVSNDGTKIEMSDADADSIESLLEGLVDYVDELGAIGDVASNLDDIEVVAGIAAEVQEVADNISTITAVNAMASDIDDVIALEPTMDAALAALQQQSRNFIWNGNISLWQRQTSFASSASARVWTADGWSQGKTALATGVTVSRQTGNNSEFAMRLARNSGQTFTDTINLVFNLSRFDSFALRGKQVVLGLSAKRGANYSAVANELLADIVYTTHTSEQPITNAAGTFDTDHNALGSVSCTLGTSVAHFKGTFTIPANATQVAIRIRMTGTGTAGANDWAQIENVFLCLGAGNVAPRPLALGETYREATRFYRKSYEIDAFEGQNSSTGLLQEYEKIVSGVGRFLSWYIPLNANPMHGVPTVRLYSQTGTPNTATRSSDSVSISAYNIGTHGFAVLSGDTGAAITGPWSMHFVAEYLF